MDNKLVNIPKYSKKEQEDLRQMAAEYLKTDEDITITADFFARLVANINTETPSHE